MNLTFEELRLLITDFLPHVILDDCLTEDIINESHYKSDSPVLISSDLAYDKVVVLSKLLIEFLKHRPLPF